TTKRSRVRWRTSSNARSKVTRITFSPRDSSSALATIGRGYTWTCRPRVAKAAWVRSAPKSRVSASRGDTRCSGRSPPANSLNSPALFAGTAMSGSTLGKLFPVPSFGESHGPAIGCVVDGCPPGLGLTEADIQLDLDRRKPGTSRHVTQRREDDVVEILSGVFDGKTTGTPIALLIRNVDARSKDYSKIKDTFRPGHADYTYWQKYGIRDYRGGGRQSARETAVRVAAAAVAKKWLREKYGIAVRGYLSQLGPHEVPFKTWDVVNSNPFFVADESAVPRLEEFMDKLRKSGDSVGA